MAEIVIETGDDAPLPIVESATSDNDVAIAAIRSEADLEATRIHAETERLRIESELAETQIRADAQHEREGEVWTVMSRLEDQVTNLTTLVETTLAALAASAAPPPSSPVETSEAITRLAGEIAEEMPSIPSNTQDPTNSTQTEPIVESVAESLGEIIPPVIETKRGPILKLV